MDLRQTYSTSPEEIPASFVRAWNERNAHSIANLFTEDAEFINVVGLWWHSRNAIWKAHDYGLKVIFPKSTLTMGTIKTRYLSDDAAVVYARMRLTGQTARSDEQNQGQDKICSALWYRKRNGVGYVFLP